MKFDNRTDIPKTQCIMHILMKNGRILWKAMKNSLLSEETIECHLNELSKNWHAKVCWSPWICQFYISCLFQFTKVKIETCQSGLSNFGYEINKMIKYRIYGFIYAFLWWTLKIVTIFCTKMALVCCYCWRETLLLFFFWTILK